MTLTPNCRIEKLVSLMQVVQSRGQTEAQSIMTEFCLESRMSTVPTQVSH